MFRCGMLTMAVVRTRVYRHDMVIYYSGHTLVRVLGRRRLKV